MRITLTPVNIALNPTTNKIVIYTSGCIVGSSGGGTWGTITGTLADQTDLNNALGLKVDKVTGKGLSTNDYTTIEKQKLANIEAGAEVNVNADWNATSGDTQILNKPTIPAEQIQSDYTQANTNALDYIKNKPSFKTINSESIIGTGNIEISGGLDKTFQTLTEDATITFNAATSVNGSVVLTASRNAANFINPVVGEDHTWRFVQGGTGSYGITWGDKYKTSGGAMPPLSATVGAVDLYTFKAISANEFVLVNVIHDYKAIV